MKRKLYVSMAAIFLCSFSTLWADALSHRGAASLIEEPRPVGTLRLPLLRALLVDPGPSGPLTWKFEDAEPTALTAADFDRDGVADLACGYAIDDRGLVSLHRGNMDSLQRLSPVPDLVGQPPFLNPVRLFELPVRPDYLEAGDFDGDGWSDLVAAARGDDRLFVLTGDGLGGFHPGAVLDLPGPVSALTAGEINRRDGLTDLVVAVRQAPGAALLIFEHPGGSLLADPDVVAIPSEVDSLALGRLDAEPPLDLAIGAGQDLFLLRGSDRRVAEVRMVEHIHAAAVAIRGVAVGDLVTESGHVEEIAVLLEDGTVRVLARAGVAGESEASWSVVNERVLLDRPDADTPIVLGTARVSGLGGVELLLLDPAERRLRAIGGDGREDSVEVAGDPVAVLPMRLNGDVLSDLVVLVRGMETPAVAMSAPQSTFTVTSPASSGGGTLRAAIQNANSSGGSDLIQFDIPGGAGAPIVPTTPLPTITGPVTIDGYTQPGSVTNTIPAPGGTSATLRVVLNGSIAGASTDGLILGSGSSVIRGLVIRDFSGDGIVVESDGNTVEGNRIGTDLGGLTSAGNVDGVFVFGGSNNTIGGNNPAARNVISGNDDDGIDFEGVGTVGNSALGNLIGVDRDGALALENSSDGIEISDAVNTIVGGLSAGSANVLSGNDSDGLDLEGSGTALVLGNFIGLGSDGSTFIGNEDTGIEINGPSCTIGGSAAGAGNVISGNDTFGVSLAGPDANGTVVEGNRIGTDTAGIASGSGQVIGLNLSGAPNNTIGGIVPGAGNLISGNAVAGVSIQSSGSTGNLVLGNRIGTDANGTSPIGNADGIRIIGTASNNTVGGTSPDARNVISGNLGRGVLISNSSSNTVQGNFIGSDANGTADLGNGMDGVLLFDAPTNTIGGIAMGSGNLIRGNQHAGVAVTSSSSTANPILGNSIFSNGTLGIDLGSSGVTDNDAGDGDSGANQLQNFPVLTSATQLSSGDLFVGGIYLSEPDQTYRVEFFGNAACDASGSGEGETLLGFDDVTTSGSGSAGFTAILTGLSEEIDVVTATATSPANNTSEFSACVDAVCVIGVFPQTLFAQDADTLAWTNPADVRAARGDLDDVGSYSPFQDELLIGVTSLDLSVDTPGSGSGTYYVVKPAACGSWQTAAGAEPARDASLP